jgi:hypothetical protein
MGLDLGSNPLILRTPSKARAVAGGDVVRVE